MDCPISDTESRVMGKKKGRETGRQGRSPSQKPQDRLAPQGPPPMCSQPRTNDVPGKLRAAPDGDRIAAKLPGDPQETLSVPFLGTVIPTMALLS